MKKWILVFLNYFLGFQRMRVLENTLKNSYGEDTPPVLFVGRINPIESGKIRKHFDTRKLKGSIFVRTVRLSSEL